MTIHLSYGMTYIEKKYEWGRGKHGGFKDIHMKFLNFPSHMLSSESVKKSQDLSFSNKQFQPLRRCSRLVP